MKIFKHTLMLILVSSILLANKTKADGTFYLLRHAEKQKDGTKNPHLSERGQLRAAYLAQQLSSANITKIYSTNYHRTRETVKPLSELLEVPVELYSPSKLQEFAKNLKNETGQIVIVGHSNTTPTLTALLSGKTIDDMEEGEYENLYQVVLINDEARLSRFKIFPIGE